MRGRFHDFEEGVMQYCRSTVSAGVIFSRAAGPVDCRLIAVMLRLFELFLVPIGHIEAVLPEVDRLFKRHLSNGLVCGVDDM